MDIELFLLFTFIVIAAYVLGILTHKYAINQAEAVKAHISAEIAAWRVDVARRIAEAKEKL